MYFGKSKNITASVVCVCATEEEFNSIIAFHQPFVFLITLLTALVGLHFQVLAISPLKTHFTITLLLIMAAIVFSIAYARINAQLHNSEYLSLFRFTYLASGFLICELLVGLLMSPFMVVYGEFMHIPNSRDITSLAPTNLSICLSVM